MAVYLSTTTDAFEESRKGAQAVRSSYTNIRRPLRGIQVKPNTYASIRVRTASGKAIDLFDSSSSRRSEQNQRIGISENYANFLIQTMQESRAEKQQIIETFGEDYVYFFGERPRFLEVTGMLINTQDFNWKSEFWTNYDNYLRGTKLVEQNARLYFYFDDTVVEGYMIGASTVADSQTQHMMPFRFQIFITNYAILSEVGSVFIAKSDQLGRKNALQKVAPATTQEMLAGDAAKGAGGLSGFLAKTASFVNDASFSVQLELEKIRNTLYARQLVVPKGIGTMADSLEYAEPIENRGEYGDAPTDAIIWSMSDEYVERMPEGLHGNALEGSIKEQGRMISILNLRNPQALEAHARFEFERAGIDTGTPSTTMMILGRGAFAAVQFAAPFGLQKVSGGLIGQIDQAIQQAL